jgi:hypothetical protein
MGKMMWPPNPSKVERNNLHWHWPYVRAYLPSMARVVVLLFRKCDNQLKIGLSWMQVHIFSLVTDEH